MYDFYKKIIIGLIILVCIAALIVSGIDIITWKIDTNKTDKNIANVQEEVVVEVIQDTPETEIVEPVEEVSVPENNPYWDYIKMNMINVDLTKLKEINSDTKGWLQVNGTNINYPFVQGSDNNFYLRHTFDKSYNRAGWVFLDYRNKLNEEEKNTIIYAHARVDGVMFGSLKNILNNGWLNNTNNHIIKISTEKYNYLFQVFSIYSIPNESYYIQTDFKNEELHTEFLNTIVNRSVHNFNTEVNLNTKILTLSTCHG
ncbi:MAG: class B sortase, partial [Bacilli bacterium]|nr:class B sortase [Bacilli bacterium]